MSPVFLLSPAYCGGRRAALLLRAGSPLPLAVRLRAGTLTLGEAFAFLSGLYFRGKLAYANAFDPAGARTFVITPACGLRPASAPVTDTLLREFAAVDIGLEDPRYREPLEHDLAELAGRLEPARRVVLLGSIATGKYVDVLSRWLGPRLHYPASFVGRGDMSRGGLLLRQARAGTELEYSPFDPQVTRRGARPPKLERWP